MRSLAIYGSIYINKKKLRSFKYIKSHKLSASLSELLEEVEEPTEYWDEDFGTVSY